MKYCLVVRVPIVEKWTKSYNFHSPIPMKSRYIWKVTMPVYKRLYQAIKII